MKSGEEAPAIKPKLHRSPMLRSFLNCAKFCQPPVRMVVENLQIISSFKRTMHIAWPPVFNSVVRRASLVDFNFLRLPTSACNTPDTDFFNTFNGVTIGVAGCLVYICGLWAIGITIMHSQRLAPEAVTSFNRRTLRRVILFMTLSYAPVTETVLAVYSCRLIGSHYHLRNDVAKQCYSPVHDRYTRLAGFWVAFYLAGVPATFLALLWYYNIPTVARELKRNAQLCSLGEHAHRCDIIQPTVELHRLTTSTVSAEHVDLLYRCFILGEIDYKCDGNQAMCELSDSFPPPTQRAQGLWRLRQASLAAPATALNNDQKLETLLKYSRQHLRCRDVTWHTAQDDPRLEGARKAVGPLFEEFHADRWYWTVVACLQKLIVTGLLGLVSPGTSGQVAAGLGITFGFLLFYQAHLPYKEKTFRQIGYAAAIELPIFFVFGLMIKGNVQVLTSHNSRFFDACVGVLMCSVFVLPVLLVLRRLRWSIEDLTAEDDEEEVATVRALSARLRGQDPAASPRSPRPRITRLSSADGF
jgi:hypothetical protein